MLPDDISMLCLSSSNLRIRSSNSCFTLSNNINLSLCGQNKRYNTIDGKTHAERVKSSRVELLSPQTRLYHYMELSSEVVEETRVPGK